jgi:hypothetical protein
LQLFLALAALAAILYLLGWLPKANDGKLAAIVRKSSGALFVFGAGLILTRNIGIALLGAMLAYSFLRAGPFRGGSASPQRGTMTVEQAYLVLGLPPGATRDEVQAAHRNLIRRNHPDQGGSTYIAAQVNEAKEVLLKHIKA